MSFNLPTELWISIFEEATQVPGELNANALSLLDRPSHVECWRDRQALLPTRRALIRVSRTFRAIGMPFLYQSIFIHKGITIERLGKTLKKTPKYGEWIKRIDIDLVRGNSSVFTDEALSDLFLNLPNLEFLTTFGPWTVPQASLLIKNLQYCQNLRILYLQEDGFASYDADYSNTFSSLKNLRAFCSAYWRNTKHSYMSTPNKGASLRYIMALPDWDDPETFQDPAYFPNLEVLELTTSTVISHFSRVHGHKIITIDYNLASFRVLEGLGDYFPNLRNVIIDIESLDIERQPMEIQVIPLPQVTRVGFTIDRSFAIAWKINVAFKMLTMIFPGVKRIQILEMVLIKTLLRHKFGRLLRWNNELKEKGIRLERENGELLLWRQQARFTSS